MTASKRLFLLACAALACGACNDDDSEAIRFARENTRIEDGHLGGSNMIFYGRSVTTAADGSAYVDDKARFEFAGGNDRLALYMHQTRFAAQMPSLKMQLRPVPYTPGVGAALTFALERIVPNVLLPNAVGGGYSYQPLPSYELTDLTGSIDGVLCRVGFACDVPNLGSYRVEFEGRLLEK